jgi:hypothetical protein
MSDSLVIYVLSDSIGETAERVLRAALSQFEDYRIIVKKFSYVTSKSILLQVLEEASDEADVVAYTFVIEELNNFVKEEKDSYSFAFIDLLSYIIDTIATVKNWEPKREAGLIHSLDEDYFKQVEAIEFAVKYDDGKDPRGLLKADIVLIGVSRTSKTPLSMYLAHRGYKVANVPLMPEVSPPKELFSADSRKIIGLIIDPDKLAEIRNERLKSLGLGKGATYAARSRIEQELKYALNVMEDLECSIVDVTHKAVEETANLIIEMVKNGN